MGGLHLLLFKPNPSIYAWIITFSYIQNFPPEIRLFVKSNQKTKTKTNKLSWPPATTSPLPLTSQPTFQPQTSPRLLLSRFLMSCEFQRSVLNPQYLTYQQNVAQSTTASSSLSSFCLQINSRHPNPPCAGCSFPVASTYAYLCVLIFWSFKSWSNERVLLDTSSLLPILTTAWRALSHLASWI